VAGTVGLWPPIEEQAKVYAAITELRIDGYYVKVRTEG